MTCADKFGRKKGGMDLRQNPSMNGKEGRLPARAPLAVPFVPFQEEGAPKYEAAKGLIRGTLFPGLDLPFMGMTNQKELAQTPMSELQALAFAVQELALYLDTHREDQEALNLYRSYQQIYDQCRKQWTAKKGPLNHSNRNDAEDYNWLQDPWPWEYCFNKEV